MRIEICGAIGSGKTTLAKLLGQNAFEPIFEDFKQDPFWLPFYENPGAHAFETEITFLLQHYHQVKRCNGANLVCDFSFTQDLAFAKIGLKGERLHLFRRVMNECMDELGPADLIIFLRCPPERLLTRIEHRGRPEEKNLTIDFLHLLCKASEDEFGSIEGIKCLQIESDKINLASPAANSELLSKINELASS